MTHTNRQLQPWDGIFLPRIARRPRMCGSGRQIFLALNSNSCHNIIKLEQKFIVRNARKAN